jgi:lantibiotic biosynthesis protein
MDTTTAGWHQDLGSGAAGTALARISLARTSGLQPSVTVPWIKAMATGTVTTNVSAGLFYGAPAVAFVLHTAAHPHTLLYLPHSTSTSTTSPL